MIKPSVLSGSVAPVPWPSGISSLDDFKGNLPGQTSFEQCLESTKNMVDVTVQTSDGDRVTFCYESIVSEFDFHQVGGGAETRIHEESLSVQDQLSVEVKGELDRQELIDIAGFKSDLIGIMDDFFYNSSGMVDDPMALDLSRYQALSKFSVALDSRTIKTWMSQGSGGVDAAVPGQGGDFFSDSLVQQAKGQEGSFLASFSALQYSHHSLQMTAERVNLPMDMANFAPPEVYGDIDELSRAADDVQYQSLNRLVLAEFRRVTLEVFTQKSTFAKNEADQKLNMLGNDFLDFIDQLGAKTREV